jgi:hypothetical protein
MPKMQESRIDTLPEDGVVAHALGVLEEYLSRRGLKRSSQRSTVLQVFLSADDCTTTHQKRQYERTNNLSPRRWRLLARFNYFCVGPLLADLMTGSGRLYFLCALRFFWHASHVP